MHPLRFRPLALALCAVGALCTAAPAQVLLPGQPGPGCRDIEGERPLPGSLAGVADTTGLGAALRAAGLAERGWIVVYAQWDTASVPSGADVLGSSLGDTQAREVARLLRQRLTPQPPQRTTVGTEEGGTQDFTYGWSVVARLEAGDPVRAGFGYGEECVPALEDTRAVSRLVAREVARLSPDARAALPRTAQVRMRIAPDGSVDTESVRVTRSTGVAEVDQAMARVARELRFRPARVNRRGVAVWVEVPITFSPR